MIKHHHFSSPSSVKNGDPDSALSGIGHGLPVSRRQRHDEELIRRALRLIVDDNGEDQRPRDCQDDVPIAALVVDEAGHTLAEAINRREVDDDPTAHAEVLALREAAQRRGEGWRLDGCTLVVTVEPCTMCAGAAVGARIDRIVFGAWEHKTGACGSFLDVVRAPGQLHTPDVDGGVLADECAIVLEKFFQQRRGML